MGALFGFVVGYVLGARVGSDGFDRVIAAMREVRDSEEFAALVEVARTHAIDTVTTVSQRLTGAAESVTADDLVARARARVEG